MKLFLTNAVQHLRGLLKKHGFDLGQIESYAFADGERGYRLKDNVQGESAGVVGSILPDPQSLFDLMAFHHIVRENGAQELALLIPYLGYARQDRSSRPGEGAIGIMIIELVQSIKPSQLVLIDVHSDAIRRMLGPFVRELSALPLFAKALSRHLPEVVVSPDAGYVSRARQLAGLFNPHLEIAFIDKERPRPNFAVAKNLNGDVRGKNVVILDDIIDTGRTLVEAIRLVLRHGAKKICLAATHGIFSDQARERLCSLPVDEIVVTNTLPQIRYPKIRTLDIGLLIRNALLHRSNPSLEE